MVSYTYDLSGRMKSASDNSSAIPSAVSPTGSPVAYTTNFTYDALNRPASTRWDPVVGAVTPTYDPNGNLTSDGTYTLGYDAENRLTSASGAGNTAAYTFDAQGRRKTRTVNGTTTVSVTGAQNREVLEYDGSTGALLRWHAYGLGPNAVLGQMNIPANTRTTPVPDLLGSIVGSMDAGTGALTKFAYRPYGASPSPATPFGFTGQRFDQESGLYYYRARMYSASWGRFTQTDPIGYSAGTNLYAYAANDPLNAADPTGLWAGVDDLIAAGVGTLIGLGAQGIADLATSNLSSWRSYAAGGIGGAAGGVAALYTGGAVSGAVGGATYSVANQLLTTGNLDAGRLAFDTGISAFTAGIGSVALQSASRQLSNATKGQIGESASIGYNWLQGSRLLGTQEVIPGLRTRVDSVWQSASGLTYYVESKFGTAGLTAAQREARSELGGAYHVERWGYDWVGRVGANLGLGYGLETSASTGNGAK